MPTPRSTPASPASPASAPGRGAKPAAKGGPRRPRTRLGRWLQNLRISRKLAVVITVHLIHAVVLLAVTTYSLKAVDASRAWVDGEGFWSKAQKEGVVQLLAYARSGDEANFRLFLANMNITLGDRQARLELEKPDPDLAVARAGFIQARNHPHDVDNMIWLFQTFRHEAHIDKAIGIWTRAEDQGIEPLRALGNELHAVRSVPNPDPAQVNATVGRILEVNAFLEVLEHEFSTTLGDGARFISLVVVVGTVGLTVLFVGSALLVSATVARHITRSLVAVKAGAERMAGGELGVQIDVQGRDELAAVGQAFNGMSQQLANTLRRHEEQTSAMVATIESATDGLLVVDAAGHIVHFNQKFVQMWRVPDEVLASKSDEQALAFVQDQLVDPHAFLAKVKTLYDNPEADSFDLLLFKDGRVFERYSKPQRIGTRNAGRVWSFRDITDRLAVEKEREEALERSHELARLKAVDRLKTQFINIASHELRTPLTPLRLQMHVLLTSRESPPTADQKRALEVMKRNLERLSSLVEDMLTIARSQAGRMTIKPQPVDMVSLVTESMESFEPVAKEKQIALTRSGAPNANLNADARLISQVLMNLLSNALKFTPDGGRVRIDVQDEGTNVRLSVTDSGIGLAPADVTRLFSPFVQVHDIGEVNAPGSGLGLFICRQFIELHGGTIGAESLGKGQGSTFWFVLPKTPPTPASEPTK